MIFQKLWKKFKKDNELQKIAVNMNWLFLDKAIQIGVAFFVSILVIRYLGPEQYGVLSYAIAMVGFFSVFSKLGLDAITVRELVTDKIKKEQLLGTVFYLKLFGSFWAVILAGITALLLQDNNLMVLATIIISFSLIFQSTDVIDYWFQSRVISKHIAYSRSFAYIISATIKIYLVSTGADLIWFVWAILIESILIAIGFVLAYFKNKGNIGRWTFKINVAKSLLKDSWPLILSSISVIIYMKIDQIMIGNMLGYEALGNYTVAVNLSEMWYFIPVIITTSVFPAIIKAKKHSEELYYARLQKLYDTMVWLAIAIAIPMTFLSDWIIEILYGSQYAQAGGVLAIYIWAGIFVSLGVTSGKWLLSENLQVFSLFNTLIGAVINVFLNIILINKMGITGAAWTTLISYALSAYILLFFYRKTRINFYNLSKSLFFVTIFKRYYNHNKK